MPCACLPACLPARHVPSQTQFKQGQREPPTRPSPMAHALAKRCFCPFFPHVFPTFSVCLLPFNRCLLPVACCLFPLLLPFDLSFVFVSVFFAKHLLLFFFHLFLCFLRRQSLWYLLFFNLRVAVAVVNVSSSSC